MQSPAFPEGIGNIKPIAEAAMLPAIQIQVEAAQPPLPVVASKFGGIPFTPDGFTWPRTPSGRTMEFIGQINFAEVVTQTPSFSEKLPHQGIFQFFYDIDKMVWGFDPNDQNFWRFIWYPNPDISQSVPCAERVSFPEREFPLSFETIFSLPDVWTLLPTRESREEFSDEERGVYQNFTEQNRPKHQLLGHSWNIQDDPRYTAQFASNGVYMGSPAYKNDPRTPELLKGLDDWQLLWQIDSDDRLDFMWGDDGMLYIFVKREAVQKADLSSAWLDLQCY